jgi:hypothetical protein
MTKSSNQRPDVQPARPRGMDARVPKAGDDRPRRPGLVIGPTEGGPDVELVPARLVRRLSVGRGKRRGR